MRFLLSVLSDSSSVRYFIPDAFFDQKWLRQGEEIMKSKWGTLKPLKGGDAYRK